MKKILLPLFFGAVLSACGGEYLLSNKGTSNLEATAPYIHKIQPLGVSSSCFGSYAQTVRDHRVTPTRVYTQYMLGMKGCSAPESSLVVQMLGGGQWVGGWSYVTIKKNGLCLTNPVTNPQAGVDKGETFWEACSPQDNPANYKYRQQWLLNFNNNNALRIESHTLSRIGYPNAAPECLDLQTPTVLKRGACNLHNFQIIRAQ